MRQEGPGEAAVKAEVHKIVELVALAPPKQALRIVDDPGAAAQLDEAGYYLREARLQGLRNTLVRMVRQYPLQSLLISASIGYLLSSSIRSNANGNQHR